MTHFALCFLLLFSCPDALHHGRYGTVMPATQLCLLVLLVTTQLALCSVRRLRRLWTDFTYFLPDGELGSGGRFSQWKSGFHEPLVSGSHSCSCVSCDGLWKNFIFILREGLLDLRSILVLPAWFAQGNLDIISTSFLLTSEGGFPQK